MRVLCAIGDDDVAKTVDMWAHLDGFNLTITDDAEEALDLAKHYEYDLAVLGDDLIDEDAAWLLRQMRAAKVALPALMLTKRSEPAIVVQSLHDGADDFVTVPFNKDVLIARMRAVIRRARGHSTTTIRFGPFEVDLDAKVLRMKETGRPVHLTGKEYGMMELLALRKGTTLTKEMFLNNLYGGLDEPELKIIDVFICKLRRRLEEAGGGDNYIETVWGRGYVLRDEPVPPRPGGVASHSDKVDPLSTRRGLLLLEMLIHGPMTVGSAAQFVNGQRQSVAASLQSFFNCGLVDRKLGAHGSGNTTFGITERGKAWLVEHGVDLNNPLGDHVEEAAEAPAAA